MPRPSLPSHLRVGQAARLAGVSQPSITEAVQDGRLPTRRLRVLGMTMIRTVDLRRWMRQRKALAAKLARVRKAHYASGGRR